MMKSFILVAFFIKIIMRDSAKKILVALLVISIFTLPLLSNPTGRVTQEISRPLISCHEKITSRFPSKIILTEEDPIVKQGCDNGDGLIIQQNLITLDCNGYSIKSSTGRFSGIALRSRFGVTIKNCNIFGFGSAVEMTNSNKNVIVDNSLSGLDAGVLLGGKSRDNIIKNNYFSGKLGIESNTRSGGTLIFGNDFFTDNNIEVNTQFNPKVCSGNIGNYLSPDTVDGASLQEESSCGISGKTLLAYS